MRRKLLLSILFISFLSTGSYASGWVFTQSFEHSDLIFDKVKGYDRVKLLDGRSFAKPGAPLLPTKFLQIAIPPGVEAERINVLSFESQEISGKYRIYPAQPYYPLSEFPTKDEEIEFVEPNPLFYDLSSEFPGKLAQVTNNGFMGGHHIAGIALYPLQYIPSQGKLILYTRIEFELIFKPASHFTTPVKRRSAKAVKFYSDLVKRIVINPEKVRSDTQDYLPIEEEVDYLIITDDSLVSTFQELADWKIQKGFSTRIRELSWVLSNYSGYDYQEQIRNCIRDYYSNHGTRWVLLGGDTPILPHRVTVVMDENVPSDLYFSDLDSNWDGNGNHIYGEYSDSVDMYPDVFVGRVPCNSISQAETFVNKCLRYETYPPTDYQRRILYVAEMVWRDIDAAELKDYIDSVLVPNQFQTTKLYETSDNLNKETFEDSVNKGYNIINHCGHGNYTQLSLGTYSWYNYDMDSLVNFPRHSLFYSYSCFSAGIDRDCIAEHFINNPQGGGFAYCGNTRKGWGDPEGPLAGSSAEFDIEFFRALFDSSTYQIGKTLASSRIPFVPIAQVPDSQEAYYRWTMFSLLLLGDPTLELWTDIPGELSVSHAPAIIAGMGYFNVNVNQDSALVCCSKENQVLGTAYSNLGETTVYFDSPLTTQGIMNVTVTKHDFMPYHDTVIVIPAGVPYLIYYSHGIGDSGGNNNGVVNPGETINLSITLKNVGVETGYGVTAILREEDDYITVIDSLKGFGDIDSGATAQSTGDYVIQVDPSCPDSHLVTFTLQATDGESLWISSFPEMVVEPDFTIRAIPDMAILHKEDSARIELVLTSLGGFNSEVSLGHSQLPPEVNGFLNPEQLVPPDTSIFEIQTTIAASIGIYPITLIATYQDITRYEGIELAIYLRGDANGDEIVSLADVVYLVNYIFKSGTPPFPIAQVGDVNCDNNVDIIDATYLVNYLFRSGPPPCI